MIAESFVPWDDYKDTESYLLRYSGYTRRDILSMSHEDRADTVRRISEIIKRENTAK